MLRLSVFYDLHDMWGAAYTGLLSVLTKCGRGNFPSHLTDILFMSASDNNRCASWTTICEGNGIVDGATNNSVVMYPLCPRLGTPGQHPG